MARMIRTIVSLPEKDKKWVEAESRRRNISGAEVIRLCIRDLRQRIEGEGRRADSTRVAEKHARYEHPDQAAEVIVDRQELWARATAAAGRFASGVPDLSIAHDRYAWGDAGNEAGGVPGNEGRAAKRGQR